ncbi:MAG: hypothetical protein A2508_09165 [Candidatus Lambdaproteobacteria bacterium RIFOXYD12_FULL_49_8]|nr:MAG: hypothetical protein A2508_09165 [Candidatus Lambdaproteobacteria bacterium RIFOXYD12_FULL_49_8]
MNTDPFHFDSYFAQMPTGPILGPLFASAQKPWEPLAGLSKAIEAAFEGAKPQGALLAYRRTDSPERGYQQRQTEVLKEDLIDPELMVFIGKGTLVEAGATIKERVWIEGGCQVRQGAYIRGNFFGGQGSVVGHVTEVKNAIFIRHVEAGHFAYIGDSILGSAVNLGAGTKISNLEFRSAKDKFEENFPPMNLIYQGKPLATGLSKFGALIGDGVETGCNSVLSPLVFLGRESWVLPNLSVLKGLYPPGSKLYKLADCKACRL